MIFSSLCREIIKKPVEVKTAILSAHELYACDRITTVPGAVYTDRDIQVLRIEDTSNGFISLEPCCGTHVRTTSELENFCFTSIRSTKSGTFEITAVCGQRAQCVYKNGEMLKSILAKIRVKLDTELSETELYESIMEIKRVKGNLNNNDVPFTIKESALEELASIDKLMTTKHRNSIRYQIHTKFLLNKVELTLSFVGNGLKMR